jgi:hypothetical protein
MPRYWLYKNNTLGGPAGYWGDWESMVFNSPKEQRWGGHFATRSPQVGARLDYEVTAGDVVVAYQTDTRTIVGFCVITKVTGRPGDRRLYLKPIERLSPTFPIHERKAGTSLEKSWAVRGPVMLAELTRAEMDDLLGLSGAPKRVLTGKARPGGYRP